MKRRQRKSILAHKHGPYGLFMRLLMSCGSRQAVGITKSIVPPIEGE